MQIHPKPKQESIGSYKNRQTMSKKASNSAAKNAEILQDWADYLAVPASKNATATPGIENKYTFERNTMEKSIAYVCLEMNEKNKSAEKEIKTKTLALAKKVKKDDVDFLVRELLLTKQQAESYLQESEGDLSRALPKVVDA
ncbi:unnamed protein product [Sympodiomycopsis kandeliae]